MALQSVQTLNQNKGMLNPQKTRRELRKSREGTSLWQGDTHAVDIVCVYSPLSFPGCDILMRPLVSYSDTEGHMKHAGPSTNSGVNTSVPILYTHNNYFTLCSRRSPKRVEVKSEWQLISSRGQSSRPVQNWKWDLRVSNQSFFLIKPNQVWQFHSIKHMFNKAL